MDLESFSSLPQRPAMIGELHARPYPEIGSDGEAFCLALKREPGSGQEWIAHLVALLAHAGVTLRPDESANHFVCQIGHARLKWERHTEFVTYTFFTSALPEAPFCEVPQLWPKDWAEAAPGPLMAATRVRIELDQTDETLAGVDQRIAQYFEPESLAMSRVLDGTALVAGDFRLDASGFVRFALLANEGLGARRVGRIVQRLIELQTYTAMALLGLPGARDVSRALEQWAPDLNEIIAEFARGSGPTEGGLSRLLDLSARLESLTAEHSSRFSASEAYARIVDQRISALREERYKGRQTLADFMARRFDPAMRTCASSARRLEAMTQQSVRAGDMLRTRTDVAREEQNQVILARMDDRAAQQLKLQKTVEGLSVVAISYYAVNLGIYMLMPLAERAGISKTLLAALLALPVILGVWWLIRRVRERF